MFPYFVWLGVTFIWSSLYSNPRGKLVPSPKHRVSFGEKPLVLRAALLLLI